VPTFQGRRLKLLVLSTVAILVSASAIYVYWRISAPPSSTLCVTATQPPLELRMELEKTEFQLNETVAIHLSLKNIGNKMIRVFFPYIGKTVGFIVKDADSNVVYDFPYSGFTGIGEVILKSGVQINKTFHWSQISFYNDGPDDGYSDPVSPGTYYIAGRSELYSIAESLELVEHWALRIETQSITIKVTPLPTRHVTVTYPPLELSMNLSKTAYQQNETIVVSLFLTNKGSEPVALMFTYRNDRVGFIVKDENDTEVYVHPILHLLAVYNTVLEPGEQITSTLEQPTEWNQKGNKAGKYDGKLVPPGTYKIIGRTGRVSFVGGPESGRIETPPITVAID